jgi:1-phosphatidylinositol-3-phosphate 5-kinase
MEQVAVMQNIFYKRRISRIFDLKGSLRGRFAAQKDEQVTDTPSRNKKRNNTSSSSRSKGDDRSNYSSDGNRRDNVGTTDTSKGKAGPSTLLDGDFLEFTSGRPMPLTDRAKAVFQMSILNVSCCAVLML